MIKYVSRKKVLEMLDIHFNTLYNMVERGDIERIDLGSGIHKYNVGKFLKKNIQENEEKYNKMNICYCRVSSRKQKADLDRQIVQMKKEYPEYKILYDIGSGLNFKRPKLLKLMDMAINGEINEVVISYKDRLARIGYELIETIIEKYSDGRIIILNKNEEETPEEELTKDVISIMNIYVAKVNGLRKYKKKISEEIKKGRKI